MTYENAAETLLHLVEHIDSGNPSAFNKPGLTDGEELRGALCLALDALHRAHKAEARKKELPARAGERWSAEEDAAISAVFRRGKGVRLIAALQERTEGAIQSRLIKLGLIDISGLYESKDSESPEPIKPRKTFREVTEYQKRQGAVKRPPATIDEITGRVDGRRPQYFERRVALDSFGTREDVKKLRRSNSSEMLRR